MRFKKREPVFWLMRFKGLKCVDTDLVAQLCHIHLLYTTCMDLACLVSDISSYYMEL